jgi:hypothetical protein
LFFLRGATVKTAAELFDKRELRTNLDLTDCNAILGQQSIPILAYPSIMLDPSPPLDIPSILN